MDKGTILLLALLLACPLIMLWMHATGRHGHGPSHKGTDTAPASLAELRRRRAELDARIEELEGADAEETAPEKEGPPPREQVPS